MRTAAHHWLGAIMGTKPRLNPTSKTLYLDIKVLDILAAEVTQPNPNQDDDFSSSSLLSRYVIMN
jgi:hypothetical protein